jgi:hypothetical protein
VETTSDGELKFEKIKVLGMELEQCRYRSCTAEFGVGEDWATLALIESTEPGKGHATALLKAAKEHYEAQGKRFGGSVALNERMRAIYRRLGIREYSTDEDGL